MPQTFGVYKITNYYFTRQKIRSNQELELYVFKSFLPHQKLAVAGLQIVFNQSVEGNSNSKNAQLQ